MKKEKEENKPKNYLIKK